MKYALLIALVLTLMTADLPLFKQLRNHIVEFIAGVAEQEYDDDEVASAIRAQVAAKFDQLDSKEEVYLRPILQSSFNIKSFYDTYCALPTFNERLKRQNVKLICAIIHPRIDDVEAQLVRRRPADQKSS